jgi:hypothetical protein
MGRRSFSGGILCIVQPSTMKKYFVVDWTFFGVVLFSVYLRGANEYENEYSGMHFNQPLQ